MTNSEVCHSLLFTLSALLVTLPCVASAGAVPLPEIISTRENQVPDCVTPERLMEFVSARNRSLVPPQMFDQKFSEVASLYKKYGKCIEIQPGECIGIRWDFAFFQMLFETNFLLYTGGVKPEDNNFAGIGATIGGKPGERFSSVDDGIRAHLQHLLVYARISIPDPIAQRTRKVQKEIHRAMEKLVEKFERPITFEDLAILWVGTGKATYAASINKIAKAYSDRFCDSSKVL
jgi:Mannosyl-glycoprotein endo-beta-N-acetylglucosaminidase